ncbi:hypothetical protein BDV39DRAFT_59960 [Aspergillus sergii]|uniref:Uncharacterized protein n=1 Tax=Aspergillus sergii TaxID=1034303 RepID=A0A5N6X6X7_9EURO|nr:hypothetical protein BDV39DRAFT_59960 [Aspergillus sergii]
MYVGVTRSVMVGRTWRGREILVGNERRLSLVQVGCCLLAICMYEYATKVGENNNRVKLGRRISKRTSTTLSYLFAVSQVPGWR